MQTMDDSTKLFIEAVRGKVRPGQCFQFRARGASMRPVLSHGDLLRVRRAGPEAVRPGDIVVMARDNAMTAHRLIKMERGPNGCTLITQGDTLAHSDAPAAAADMLGKVVAATDKKGRTISFETSGANISNSFFLGLNAAKNMTTRGLGFDAAEWLCLLGSTNEDPATVV